MQVYLALTDGKNVMIVKKRMQNKWWEGKLKREQTVVNQAGNFAFPGGRLNSGERPADGAKREFQEESGFDWNTLPPNAIVSTWQNNKPGLSYHLVMITLTPDWYCRLVRSAKDNVKQESGREQPSVTSVKDWEWDTVCSVPKRELCRFLGVEQLTPEGKQECISLSRNRYTQSIDWYADMAKLVATRFDWAPA